MTVAFRFRGRGGFSDQRRVGPSRWDWFDLLWIHRGAIAVSFLRRPPIEIVAGQGVLIYPDTRFEGAAITASAQASVLHFEIRDQRNLLEPIRRIADERRGVMHVAHDEIDDDIVLLQTLGEQAESAFVHDMMTAQLAVVLGRLLEVGPVDAMTPQVRAMRDLTDWLAAHLDEPIALEDMAARLKMSPSHFRARFREMIGDAPGRYLQRLRMQDAAHRLRASDEPIKQIAAHVGYTELANFYRAFRAAYGMTPAAYRERYILRG